MAFKRRRFRRLRRVFKRRPLLKRRRSRSSRFLRRFKRRFIGRRF
ncbi:hypothetical protein [Dipodfec virus UA06Rod_22]|uniref:Uncharacterized protein n=1 Tax=Dipodfec virus UA06Rod_22 TaxID=2929322 RepID=A0A976R7J4_9VIRU|nr:hypothetical protein [Dipodfec virus UA06Rod_22]